MKDINIICTHFYPDTSSAASRIRSIVDILSKTYSINVIYLTTEKNEKIDHELKNIFKHHMKIDFFPVIQKKYDRSNLMVRMLYEIYYSFRLTVLDKRKKAKLSIISVPFLFLLPVSGMSRLLMGGRKSILDVRDLTWKCFDVKKSILLKIYSRLIEKLCLFSSKKFDFLVTTTKSQLEYFKKNGVNIPKKVIKNGISLERFKKLKNLKKRKEKYKDYFVILYAGRVGYPQNLMTMVKTAEIMRQHKNILFLIVGTGNEIQSIENYIKTKNLDNVKLTGEVSWEKVTKLYQEADILYAKLKNTYSLRTALPAKIFEYSSTGLPFIYGGYGEGKEECIKIANVHVVKPDDPTVLKNKILELYENGNALKINSEVMSR